MTIPITVSMSDDDGNVTHLFFQRQAITSEVTDKLARMPKLKNLVFFQCTMEAELSFLAKASFLEELVISITPLCTEHHKSIGQATTLRTLGLGNTQTRDADIASLKGLQQLQVLTLGGNPAITNNGLAELGPLRELRALTFSGLAIDDDGVQHLAGLQKLHSVSAGSTQITGVGFEHLRKLPDLDGVGLNGCAVTEDALRTIATLPHLLSLSLIATPVKDQWLRHLTEANNLERLRLSETAITDAGLEHIARIPAIRYVELDQTKVTNLGIQRLKMAKPDLIVGP